MEEAKQSEYFCKGVKCLVECCNSLGECASSSSECSPALSASSSSSDNSLGIGTIIGLAVAGAVVLGVVIVIIYHCYKRRQQQNPQVQAPVVQNN